MVRNRIRCVYIAFFIILGIRTGGFMEYSELIKLIPSVNILGKE
jgi:hypothetical protein